MWGEVVKLLDRKFGGGIREVVASDVCMAPYLAQGRGESPFMAGLE